MDRIYRVPVPRKADAIIASCGGYPKDMSLYQGTKTIDNVESGLKIGGGAALGAVFIGLVVDIIIKTKRRGRFEKR